ncbi:MAG: sulfatase [Cyclobacteriaceae bacterium]
MIFQINTLFMFRGYSIIIIWALFAYSCQQKKSGTTPHKSQLEKKNVVFILIDDMGWKDLGCYGSSFYETPNIDRLASKATLFTSAYSANPVCSPSRAAILTGRHPSRVGITDWIKGHDPQDRLLLGSEDIHELPHEEVTIAEVLKEKEYKTFYAGKWHLGDVGFFPEDQGFDVNKGGHHMGHPPGGYYSPYNNPKLTDGHEGEYLTDRLTDESIQFVEENRNDPFLLYLAYYTVHTPIEACQKHIARFEKKKKNLQDTIVRKKPERRSLTVQNQVDAAYASMIYSLDENVGRILDKLEELALMENTLIVFTSDNGGLSTTERNYNPPTSVKPLRAGKGWAYEGGIRVPLIIKSPGQSTGEKKETPVASMDLFPTILDVLGLNLRPEFHLDGRSLLPVLNGATASSEEMLFWDYPHYHSSGWTPGQAIRKGDWKLIYFFEEDTYELYNLRDDISETNNLALTNPEKLEELQEALNDMRVKYKTQSPTRNHNFQH